MTDPLQERLGHRFRNTALLEQALTHRSAADPRRRMLDSNERLEFLGDRVLGLCIAEWLAERFPQEREGDLGKRLATLCSQDVIAPIAERMGLAEALRVPPSEGRTGLRARATVLADALEAVLGAIYLDAGLEVAQKVVRREWAAAIEVDAKPPVSAKNRLQEWTLGRGLGLPDYQHVSVNGPSHAPVFVVTVLAAGRSAEGMGESKRAAEQAAAESWLGGIQS
ncbi:ribonuclease III [Roseococcus sp. SYP-B2431]|uniref:ribonuclease III n=1 Tax=Roseococcus sp. SYP-B2431 TaxID=2496640 RepID=UPI00103E2A21|nr:ribonuclease III [Roseococcus sp. SYP-B2431]TCH96448.1 ribonuclease III [Roseococcus sp. SYP-B2431]